MNRRRLLTALGGLGLTAGGAWVATNGLGGSAFSVTVETIDARGSEAGSLRLPVTNRVTVLDLFATWCGPCEKQMESLTPVAAAYGDDVAFVSVTNERFGGSFTREFLRGWWRDHDGDWTLGHDPEGELMSAVGANGLPYLVVTAPDGSVTWQHGGVASESKLRGAIDAALER
jgi:thiol-disulfide isomerase/thioredoxin